MISVRVVCAGIVFLASAAPSTQPSAGVILSVNGRVTVERPTGPVQMAALGMRLDPVDVVVVERGAAAEVYLRGGGVVRLKDATRFEMPKAADAAGAPAKQSLASGSIAQLESGLWVLNDPKGSLLVSPMRGDAAWGDDSPMPLTPRYEALTSTAVRFLWIGGPPKARVVVAKKREVIWKSDPAAPGSFFDPARGPKLAAGDVYTWWLEPPAGGPPLSAGTPFRIAPDDVIERTKSVESELRSMYASGDAVAADYLRVAHYTGAGSWTRVLDLANRMPAGDARDHATQAAISGLRLDLRSATELSQKLGAEAQR